MWDFDWYWTEYLRLCSERGMVPMDRNKMRANVAPGANPVDAFAFFEHLTVDSAGHRAVVLGAPGYDSLAAVLRRAFDQAADGKGKERHANDKPFDQQPMQQIADRRGIGFILGQADKKSEEAQGMLDRGQREACVKELLGAMVYLAGAVIFVEKSK